MKLHYISTREAYETSYKLFASSHYIELPDKTLLIAAEFADLRTESRWRNRTDVIALPHPLSGQQVKSDIATRLAHLGAQPNHTVFDIAELASQIHPELSLYA